MAKRKRLSPAVAISPETGLETKSAFGWVGHGTRRPPIADVSGEAAQQSAFEEVAAELRAARSEGRMVLRLPLSSVEADHLVRDRIDTDPEEMAVLSDSLRARGQQTPVEVIDLGGGRYGLISGWRRLMALQALSEEDAERFGFVQALVRAPETASDAYRAMVEENEIRADLSFYERARIAVQSARLGLYSDPKQAVQSLFSSARAPKRSKIVGFTRLVEALDDDLRFPAAIPEKLGLALVQALQNDAGFARRLRAALHGAAPEDAEAERRILDRALRPPPPAKAKAPEVAPGIRLKKGRGTVTLSGAKVDATLVADLSDWLTARAAKESGSG